MPTPELLVSELVTNAIRYARGRPSTLRLVLRGRPGLRGPGRLRGRCPRLRHAPTDDDESGRGLQVVSQLAQRWGARRTAAGKVVWCEQTVPGVDPDASKQVSGWPGEAWPGESHHRE